MAGSLDSLRSLLKPFYDSMIWSLITTRCVDCPQMDNEPFHKSCFSYEERLQNHFQELVMLFITCIMAIFNTSYENQKSDIRILVQKQRHSPYPKEFKYSLTMRTHLLGESEILCAALLYLFLTCHKCLLSWQYLTSLFSLRILKTQNFLGVFDFHPKFFLY